MKREDVTHLYKHREGKKKLLLISLGILECFSTSRQTTP